jgi:hypothetical protein
MLTPDFFAPYRSYTVMEIAGVFAVDQEPDLGVTDEKDAVLAAEATTGRSSASAMPATSTQIPDRRRKEETTLPIEPPKLIAPPLQ